MSHSNGLGDVNNPGNNRDVINLTMEMLLI